MQIIVAQNHYKMKKTFTLFILSMFLFLDKNFSQKLSFADIINKVYKSPNILGADTIYCVLHETALFIDTCSIKSNLINVVFFKNEEKFEELLSRKKDYSFLVKFYITDISSSLMTIKIYVSKTNISLYSRRPKTFVFQDESLIQCKLIGNCWVYDKTLKTIGL